MDESLRADRRRRASSCPQVAARPFGMLLGFPSRHAFAKRPTYRRLAGASCLDEELAAALREPDVRAQILAEDDLPPEPGACSTGSPSSCRRRSTASTCSATRPTTSPTRDTRSRRMAEADGVDPLEMLYDLLLEHDAQQLLMLPFFNYSDGNHDAVREMLLHPAGCRGLSDGGAHCGLICDASIPTFMLTHWARDRATRSQAAARVGGQEADRRHRRALRARRPRHARRGQEGRRQRDRLRRACTLRMPRMAYDLPAGGARLLQDADGYVATIVSGEVTRRDGDDTGARPGQPPPRRPHLTDPARPDPTLSTNRRQITPTIGAL